MKLRKYQLRCAQACEKDNTIVVLPTGSGKTLIAAEVIRRLQPPALFLVPTCLLVDQQAEALSSWTGLNVAKYRGGTRLPPSFDVIVSTPKAFQLAQRSPSGLESLRWGAFRVVVFDEVHHVLKDHPYRKLALSLHRSALQPPSSPTYGEPRVVGLTASYSYAVGDAKTKTSLTKMCHELRITKTETASREELKGSGYHATGASAEVLLAAAPCPSAAYAAPAAITPPGVVPVANRKPHQMGETFFSREARGTGTAFSRRLLGCVRGMEEAAVAAGAALAESCQQDPQFASPMPPTGALPPREWGAYAHKIARGGGGGGGGGGDVDGGGLNTPRILGGVGDGGRRSKGVARKCTRCGTRSLASAGRGGCHGHHPQRPDLPPSPSSVRLQIAELEHWYEAVKTLVVTWEEGEDEAATILDIFGCTGSPSHRTSEQRQEAAWPAHVLQKISTFWAAVPKTFPRYEHLKGVLLDKHEHHGGSGAGLGEAFRGIVFVRQRMTTHALAHVIDSDPDLAPLFTTACLYAASSPATASLSVTKAKAQASIEAFRSGGVNLLLATNVGEEGMDIPAANCVIRYDAMEHAVSMVQGRGRARKEDSSFVVLRERPDRTTADLEAVERQQQRLVKNFEPPTDSGVLEAAMMAAQRSRERGARRVLL
ncbi:unnamed protein product, partial [Hapterophycus canaliculatus]